MTGEIYCPRCATPCSPDASFCRSCGLQLAAIGSIVRGESPLSRPDRYRPNVNFMRLGMGLFIFGMVLALGGAALKQFDLFPEEWGKTVFLTFIALGMACLGLGFVVPNRRRRHRTAAVASPLEIQAVGTTSQLPEADLEAANAAFSMPARESVMSQPGSVTEGTTRHLKEGN